VGFLRHLGINLEAGRKKVEPFSDLLNQIKNQGGPSTGWKPVSLSPLRGLGGKWGWDGKRAGGASVSLREAPLPPLPKHLPCAQLPGDGRGHLRQLRDGLIGGDALHVGFDDPFVKGNEAQEGEVRQVFS